MEETLRQFLVFFALGGAVAAFVSGSIGPLIGVALGFFLILSAVHKDLWPRP